MSRLEALRASYCRYVSLPWDHSLPGQQRVWFAVYDPGDERRLRLCLHLTNFETATKESGHDWRSCDLTGAFARWMAGQEYREAYFKSPKKLLSPHPGFEAAVADQVLEVLKGADSARPDQTAEGCGSC